jgi:exopolysaccharide biosynthesis protein
MGTGNTFSAKDRLKSVDLFLPLKRLLGITGKRYTKPKAARNHLVKSAVNMAASEWVQLSKKRKLNKIVSLFLSDKADEPERIAPNYSNSRYDKIQFRILKIVLI